MIQRIGLVGRLAFVLFFSSISNAERLPIKTYTVADGLLRDIVAKIKQDSRGFLWFCTAEGISRFDGYAFTNFTVTDGLPERHVNDFLETRNGEIWIATDGGLAKLNPKGLAKSKDNPLFTTVLSDNPKAKSFRVLFEDENSVIWVGTSDGLYKLTEKSELEAVDLGKPVTGVVEVYVNTIIRDRRGAMWIGTTGNGLFRLLPNGEVEQFTQEDGLPDINISILLEDKSGRIWAGLLPRFSSGLCLLVADPQKNQSIVERHYTTKDGLPDDWVTDLFEASDDKFWVATVRGLCQWRADENLVCKTYSSANNLCDTEAWSILDDKDKNFWIGTRCGLKKWTRHGFTTFDEPSGTISKQTNSIFENAAGELFVSFNDGGIRTVGRFNGEEFDLTKPKFPSGIGYFGWGDQQTVWQDSVGDWFFPTGGGLFRFSQPARLEDLARITPQRIEFGTERKEIFRLFEDSRGDFWIATTGATNGLWRWERAADVWHDYTGELGIGKNRIGTAFVEDRSGNLWIGTGEDNSALIRYRDGQFKIFTRNESVPEGWMRDLFVDHAGRLWIANTTVGLLRLDDVNSEQLNFVRYTPADGLSSIGVLCVTEDEFGRIYIGTGRGLDRLTPETGQIENFTTADGLPNSVVTIAYRDRKNNLWFGTTGGLARFIPEPEREREPPQVFIMGFRVSGVPQSVSILGETTIPSVELTAGQRQVTVDFLGLGTNLGERLKYEYRFGDSDWTATPERTVNFANLASGEYRFEVRAQTADRIYSQSASVDFRIAAPLWQRPWFIASALFLTALAIFLFYRNRLERLLEMERMRTRIATDLHDDIGANLTRIALLSEVANQETHAGARNGKSNLLPSIADIARESVASMNDIVWAISPEHDSLLDVTRRMRQHAEEVFTFRDIDLDFKAPAADADLKLSVDVRRDLLLIFKEAVNNAARHSACTKVWIDFRREDSILSLQIKDNGKGFTPDPENDGQGLRSMTRRGAALGGKLEIDSSNGEGTIVKFVLPLRKPSQVK